MKKIILGTLLAFFMCAFSQSFCFKADCAENDPGVSTELYRYRMDWLGIPVGDVTFRIIHNYMLDRKEVCLVEMKAKTNRFASAIYRIDDTYTSYVDRKTLLPIRYDVDRHDGTYNKKATTYFDRKNLKAHFENYLDQSKKTYDIPADVLDPVSCVMKIRSLGLKAGGNYHLKIDNNEQIYDIYGFVEKECRIKIKDFGEFDAVYISPYAVLNGVKYKKGTVFGYFSKGENPIILFAEGKASIFSIMTANLVEKKIT